MKIGYVIKLIWWIILVALGKRLGNPCRVWYLWSGGIAVDLLSFIIVRSAS